MGLAQLRSAVLEWYGPRRHAYAWRRGPRSPYRTLVSEVMLQQTQAARVEPIFEAFLVRFPDVGALAGHHVAAHEWNSPQSTLRVCPVMALARSLARNSTTSP